MDQVRVLAARGSTITDAEQPAAARVRARLDGLTTRDAARLGRRLKSLRDVSPDKLRHIADQVTAAEAVVAAREYGTVDPLPVVEWMYEYGNYRRFTQTALLALPATVSDEELVSVLQAVIDAHDMLRATVVDGSVVTRAPGAVDAHTVLAAASGPDLAALITPAARAANDRIDPDTGAMLAATRFNEDAPDVAQPPLTARVRMTPVRKVRITPA